MGTLESTFSEADLDLICEAIDIWERQGRGILGLIEDMKRCPCPDCLQDAPEEVKEAVEKLRQHLLGQEKELKSTQQVKTERSTLLKAKIIMQKMDCATAKL